MRLWNKSKQKLKKKNGETLIETMAALVIAVLSMSFLSSATLAAAKINQQNKLNDTLFSYSLQYAESMIGMAGQETDKVELKVTFQHDNAQWTSKVDLYGDDLNNATFVAYDYKR